MSRNSFMLWVREDGAVEVTSFAPGVLAGMLLRLRADGIPCSRRRAFRLEARADWRRVLRALARPEGGDPGGGACTDAPPAGAGERLRRP